MNETNNPYGYNNQENPNPQYNQNAQYNQNPQYNQNAQYNQNPQYNQNVQYNQNAQYNQNPQYNQNVQYNQNQQYNPNGYMQSNVNYNMAAPSNTNVVKMIIGIVVAIAISALGVAAYCLLGYSANMIVFFMGAVIFLCSMFAYTKIVGKTDTVGVIVCIVLSLIAVYLGTRMGTIYAVLGEVKDVPMIGEVTYDDAKEAFELAYELDDATKMEYIKNMALGYVFSIAGVCAFFANKKKGRR